MTESGCRSAIAGRSNSMFPEEAVGNPPPGRGISVFRQIPCGREFRREFWKKLVAASHGAGDDARGPGDCTGEFPQSGNF
jgi:hypothetical protein